MFNACSIKYFYVFLYRLPVLLHAQEFKLAPLRPWLSCHFHGPSSLPMSADWYLPHSASQSKTFSELTALCCLDTLYAVYASLYIYTVFRTPLSFRFWSLQKVSWDLDVCSTANGMERFPVPHLVDFCRICQSILLAVSCWGGVDYQRQKKLKM